MNIDRLKQAESEFLQLYPLGFADEGMADIVKKHSKQKLNEKCQAAFAEVEFNKPLQIVDNMSKFICQSSLISLFEKPKLRDFIKSLDSNQKEKLSEAFYEQLHGNQESGFNQVLDILLGGKLAKWSLISVLPYYMKPTQEVFIKPTTTKNIIQQFELEGVIYKPRPSWEFYNRYKQHIIEMKSHVEDCLKPSNAAFSGFLMMVMK